VLWALYALAYLLLNGAIVDETVVSAQILTGAVDYPAGHPHELFHRQALSLTNHVSAAIAWVLPGYEAVSFVRNFLFLFLSGFVPYLVGTLLTGRWIWGLCASALVLADCAWILRGVYPTFVFPTFYSHGHIGAYGALLVVCLLVTRRWRLGGLLLGLFPGIHLLLAALLWAWGALWLGLTRARPRGAELRRLLVWLAGGLAACLVSFLGSWLAGVEGPASDVWRVAQGGEQVRENFIAFTDIHRQMPAAGSARFQLGYLGNSVIFGTGALLLLVYLRRQGSARFGTALGIVGFALLALVCVWGSRAWYELFGGLPDAVETAMPNRLSNLAAVLVIPVFVAGLRESCAQAPPRIRRLALLLIAALVLGAAALTFARWYPSRIWVGKNFRLLPLYGLLAAGLAAATVLSGSRVLRGVALLAAAAIAWLLADQRDLVGNESMPVFLGGFLAALALFRLQPGHPSAEPGRIVGVLLPAALCLLCMAAALRTRQADEASTYTLFDRELCAWLDEHARPDEMLLPPLLPRTQLQAKSSHPVLLELGTLWLMPYFPELSSVIGRMTAELYGVDYSDRAGLEELAEDGYLGQYAPVWRRAWTQRSTAQWTALGQRWGFRLVVAPADWPLALEPALVADGWALYSLSRDAP
jgi:hypothetical protein